MATSSYLHYRNLRYLLAAVDEREDVQKKTFTKWINARLSSPRPHSLHAQLSIITDLYEDLRDGTCLLALLQTLTAIPLVSISRTCSHFDVMSWADLYKRLKAMHSYSRARFTKKIGTNLGKT